MIIEGKQGEVIGYASAAPDVKTFQRRCEREWAPRMRRKYPPVLINSQSTLDPIAKVTIFYNIDHNVCFKRLMFIEFSVLHPEFLSIQIYATGYGASISSCCDAMLYFTFMSRSFCSEKISDLCIGHVESQR